MIVWMSNKKFKNMEKRFIYDFAIPEVLYVIY